MVRHGPQRKPGGLGQHLPGETVLTVCLDCPVLKEDGSPTGLYYQAGEFCPEDRQQQICLPSFGREPVGNAVAGDALWDYEAVAAYGLCTLHTEAPPEEDPDNPDDPDDPGGPDNPDNPQDPNNPQEPGNPQDPNNPDNPDNPGGSVNPPDPSGGGQPSGPDVPLDPLDPSDNMVG